jgi:hypothetical protein
VYWYYKPMSNANFVDSGNWPTGQPFFPLSAEADSPQKGISVGKEPVDQLQHRDAWAAGETKDPSQAVGLVHWDHEGELKPPVYILQHDSRCIMSGAMGQSADQHLGHGDSPF